MTYSKPTSHKYTLRFNLGKGKNYMKWKLYDRQARKAQYLDPQTVQIFMRDCKLINQTATASKIHNGAHKAVCAWIAFNDYTIKNKHALHTTRKPITYNPRIIPNWQDWSKDNADNKEYTALMTNGNRLYLVANKPQGNNHDIQ